MCPISGLVQFLIVVVTVLLMCHALVANCAKVTFKPENVTLHMYDQATIEYEVEGEPGEEFTFQLYSKDDNIAEVENNIELKYPDDAKGQFNITGNFLGKTVVTCKAKNYQSTLQDCNMDVIVIRKKRVIDTIFTASVATLVSIIYVNFGCALNWGELRKSLKRPIGPVLGFIGQFLFMPLLSFGLGKVLFPDSPEMQLGMFFTGVSPAGGASNVWTVILEGNIDLSITMTTISTFAAFGMMPLWIFTLGRLIFDKGNVAVPYSQISTYAIGLVVPLAIGYLIQRYLKRLSRFLARILKCFSSILILFIIIFAIITNLYLFKLFSWQIVVAGMGLPYLGYLLAYIMAKVLKQSQPDCLAIAIEAGIQNTGIAIFLLRFSLPQPEADLTTVAPVAVAIMTPFPLLFMYIYKKIMSRCEQKDKQTLTDENAKLDLDNNCNNEPKPTCKLQLVS
ncbi:ileal sodium/bile acid cotransporter-like isoform X2 [Aethina tumida]|nr:ileal sodium/bile acid cotransporter-like isoform X2 [Aethina tumida]XP_049824134.1 ileal sodium/bile acid cotransporter-like isoform X2 [Aethina tumida]